MLRHQQDLIGPVSQFLTGLFPAVFGGNMEGVKTASGYAMARDQAMGRLGLVWRRTKQFYADVMLLGVDCFRKNRPEDAEIPLLGPDGVFDSRVIRLADLKGNIAVHPEADESFPRLKSQQRGVLQQLFGINDPVIQRALSEPANIGYIKNVLGLTELVVPGEDARNKQLREIQQLLASVPVVVPGYSPGEVRNAKYETRNSSVTDAASQDAAAGGASPAPTDGAEQGAFHELPVTSQQSPLLLLPSVPVDELLDDHAAEFEECKRWANSDAGQAAKMTNPAGFANVRAHAEAHLRAMAPPAPAAKSGFAIQGPQIAPNRRVPPPPAPAELYTTSAATRAPRESSSRSDERDGPGDRWVTIDGNHVLIHEPQGREPAKAQPVQAAPATSVTILGKNVPITYDASVPGNDQRKASEALAATAELLNKNADKLSEDEKKAIGEIKSLVITEDPNALLGGTGKGSVTFSFHYIRDSSREWLASLFGHEGQHYLNAGKYSGDNLWRDEQSASRTQLGIGDKIGFSAGERKYLRNWFDERNREAMQKHMAKGLKY